MLKVAQLSKSRTDGDHKRQILNRVGFALGAGESMSIMGASGSGKSTLLSLLAALETPDTGNIIVDGNDITLANKAELNRYRKQQVAVVFQQFNLIDCLDVLDNIGFCARLNGNFDAAYIQELQSQLGIDRLLGQMPNTLSGGEQQRVAIARALAHKPRLVLADEPTGNLDFDNGVQVSGLLYDTCQRQNTALIVVTHSPDVAKRADKQYFLRNGILHFVDN